MKFIGQKVNLGGVHSRIIYDVFVNDLQNHYTLKIKDGQNNFEYTKQKMKRIFVRPSSTALLSKHKVFQFVLLHGITYTVLYRIFT